MSDNNSTDIFVSYVGQDGREHAASLRERITAEGFTIWQDVVSR